MVDLEVTPRGFNFQPDGKEGCSFWGRPKMQSRNLFRLGPGLVLRIGAEVVNLSPRDGLRLAENLARRSFRQMLEEEAKATSPARRAATRAADRRRPH
jgi:hypothetical protein